MREYLEPAWFKNAAALGSTSIRAQSLPEHTSEPEPAYAWHWIATVKLYIGGKQARPDSGYSMEVTRAVAKLLGEAPLGNRKDIRNAVEAARKAGACRRQRRTRRAQVLYYLAENLAPAPGRNCAGNWREAVGEKQADAGKLILASAHLYVCGVG